MTDKLIKTINSHLHSAINDAYFTGTQHGLEISKRVLNGIALTTEEQTKETMDIIKKLQDKWLMKEQPVEEKNI